MDSEEIAVAAGDEALKRAVELDRNGACVTELDDAIDPSLQVEAEKARQRLEQGGEQAKDDGDRDLWVRLRSLYQLDLTVSNTRIEQQLSWYMRHPRYIERVVERGSRYLHHIVNEIEERGLPGELALLPIVESAFDPFAYSHGRAAGLWQFIPNTGRAFGLNQSWWYDQRRDVLDSTDAALQYLERLANRFDGDYTLALASYNAGAGTVSSAIRRNQRLNQPTDYWNLRLPNETLAYVPKLIALAKIFQDPEAYGIDLPSVSDEPYFEVVETGSQLDLAQAASLAGVDIGEIYLLNPAYNRWATAPDGPHRLLVPATQAAQFREGLDAMDPRQRVAWEHYRVNPGDTLIRIANRFNTTPAVIQQANNLNGHMIRVGQALLIPRASEDSDVYALSASQRLERTQARGTNSNGTRLTHTVTRGDTFWDLARKHNVSVRQLAQWNGMAPGDPLIPGKQLVIWSQNTNAATTAAVNSARGDSMVRRVGYRVRQGDSLSAIASRFSVNVSDIAQWNNLNVNRYLQPGQSLVLYVDIRNSP